MKKSVPLEALLTVHINPEEMWACLVEYTSSYSLAQTWHYQLPFGTIRDHLYRVHALEECFAAITKELSTPVPLAISLDRCMIQESFGSHEVINHEMQSIFHPLSTTQAYRCSIPKTALFQWQLLCIHYRLQALIITSAQRALHEAVARDTIFPEFTSCADYTLFLEHQCEIRTRDSFMKLPAEEISIGTPILAEALGLYLLGNSLYESV